MYFKTRACLAAYMNILRRNLEYHVHIVKPWRVTNESSQRTALLMSEAFEASFQ